MAGLELASIFSSVNGFYGDVTRNNIQGKSQCKWYLNNLISIASWRCKLFRGLDQVTFV